VIVILGGGVAGSAVAWALARRGAEDVHVFDAHPGQGSTHKALGGFRTQHGSKLNVELALQSRDFFASRAEQVAFQPNGYLYLADTDDAADALRERAAFQRDLGLPIEHPDPQSLIGELSTGDLRGAANFCGLDGLYLPPLILACYREEATAAGAVFHNGEAAVAGVVDQATAVVVAAGCWSREVGADLGVDLAVTPHERGVWMVGPFDWLKDRKIPMTLEAGSGYHFRERDAHLLVMGPGDQRAWGHYQAWLRRRIPAAAAEAPSGHWRGNYEVTFDHHALVGETERDGVWACCGFSGHGVMQSPAVGECLAAMILGETPPLDISALSPLREEPLLDTTQL
jgi:sarcosine oxidase subunit beta